MVSTIWINIGLGNGLVPDGIKPVSDYVDPMLTYCQMEPQEIK